jgi:3',5'-cyclic AMP phosphodiesterase CpdA
LDLNAKNILKLLSKPDDGRDTVTVLFIGDSHRYYDELEALIVEANRIPHLDFVILDGDITDFGLLEQFLWINQRLEKLNVPYICVIGNHDLTGNGSDVYAQLFGEKNFSFTYKKYKFLFHDSNGREYKFNGNVPNLWWLTNELNDSIPKWFIPVSHIPPFSEDYDKTLEKPYNALLASKSKCIASLHAHMHEASDSYNYNDRVRYIVCNSVEKKKSTLLKLINGQVIKSMLAY